MKKLLLLLAAAALAAPPQRVTVDGKDYLVYSVPLSDGGRQRVPGSGKHQEQITVQDANHKLVGRFKCKDEECAVSLEALVRGALKVNRCVCSVRRAVKK